MGAAWRGHAQIKLTENQEPYYVTFDKTDLIRYPSHLGSLGYTNYGGTYNPKITRIIRARRTHVYRLSSILSYHDWFTLRIAPLAMSVVIEYTCTSNVLVYSLRKFSRHYAWCI